MDERKYRENRKEEKGKKKREKKRMTSRSRKRWRRRKEKDLVEYPGGADGEGDDSIRDRSIVTPTESPRRAYRSIGIH